MDVNNLYTDIDHKRGTDACYKKLETRKNKTVLRSTLKSCIQLFQKSNIFRFSNTFHLLKRGTGMGTSMAANYANLFMKMFETLLLNDFHKKAGKKPLIWVNFIDNIFFIWAKGEDSLTHILAFC